MTEMQKLDIAPATTGERSAELTAIVASAAPWIGGPIAEIIGGVATNLKIRRVTDFVKTVLARVEALHNEASELFVKSEDFADIFEKTAQAVADERDEEKRVLFADYLLNNVADPSVTYNQRLKCLRVLQEIDTRHIDLIAALLQRPAPGETGMMISAPRTIIHSTGELPMRKEYDFTDSVRNPYAKHFRKQVTMRLGTDVIEYFKALARETGMPYQNLINLYLRDCAHSGKKLALKWAS